MKTSSVVKALKTSKVLKTFHIPKISDDPVNLKSTKVTKKASNKFTKFNNKTNLKKVDNIAW